MKILKINTEKRKIGNLGEKLAVNYLKKQGYKIRERNYVANGNEIDIIAEIDETLVFIEVKTRSFKEEKQNILRPALAVTPEKQRKIIGTAKFYANFNAEGKRLRLDIIEVLVENKKLKEINHMEGAFNFNTAFRTGKL